MDEAQVADVATPETDVAAEPEIQSNDAPTEASDTPPPVQEKMIPQSQLDKLIAREKRQAAEKARSEAFSEFERNRVQQDVAQPTAPSMGGIPQQFSPEQFEQHIMAAAQRMSVQMTADKMAQDFESKINAEIQADPDFGDAYDKLKIGQHPELVIWMNGMDNSAKVVKDLAANPAKYAHILMLAKSGMPELAQGELVKLHESIKTNQAALAQPKVKEPLDHLSPSSVGIDNGEMSVSDYMKQDWLRG